ncbi:GFA family protein [Solilutibacter silvestris]|uniref:GFA family protein n=1 Tax=Solilutibacter silvestris TaxID=1645665 RepID=UPI003D32A28E
MKLSGGCLCGQVRYEASADPVFSGNCHCTDCQHASGGPYAPVMMFPPNAVNTTGPVKYFASKGDSGHVIERGFCQNCGSQLFVKLEAVPGMVGIRPGSLDAPANFQPDLDFFVSSAQPWDHMNPELPKRQRSPQG